MNQQYYEAAMRSFLLPTSLVLAALTVTGCGTLQTTLPAALTPNPAPPSAHAVPFVAAEDVRPSQTISDWVTYADYVAVVTVQTDKLREPTKAEVQRGEGDMLRDLTLSIDTVLWTNPVGTTKLPATIDWEAIGSAFSDGGKVTTQLAIRNAPRMELGHTYVLALYRHAQVCSEGDEREAFWDGLGGEGILPYDEQSIGEGESQGVSQGIANAKTQTGTIESEFAGRDAKTLADSLMTAKPHSTKLAPFRDPACG